MNESDILRVSQNTKDILRVWAQGSSLAEARLDNCIDEVSLIYKKYYDQGLSPRALSHVLLETSISMLVADLDLREAKDFCEFVRDCGERSIRSISTNWPPIDKTNWPFDPEQWPADWEDKQ